MTSNQQKITKMELLVIMRDACFDDMIIWEKGNCRIEFLNFEWEKEGKEETLAFVKANVCAERAPFLALSSL